MNEISEAYDNVESELETSWRELENTLSSDGSRLLKERVESQVEMAMLDINRVIEVRQDELDELARAGRRQAKDDPDVFERVSAQIETIHPEGIAEDVQEATQFDGVEATHFDGIAENYRQFAERLQSGPVASKVASRYVLPSEAVQAMMSQCAVPFEALESPLGNFTESVKSHVQEIDEITSSKLGKGIAAFANITSSLAMGAATSALTGSAFVGRSARKEASSGIGGWVAKKYFGSDMKEAMGSLESSFYDFASEYEKASAECEKRLELTTLTLYGGILRHLEQDLGEAHQTVGDLEWESGLVDPKLSESGTNMFVSWAERTKSDLEDLEEEEKWAQFGDAAESALHHTLENRARSQTTGLQDDLAYATTFARKRAEAVMEVADEAWKKEEYVAAAQLYLDLLAGSPVGFDCPERSSAIAGWRLALVGTDERAPDALQERALDFLPFVQQVKVREEVQDGRYAIPGECIPTEAEETAAVLSLFAQQTGFGMPAINRRVTESVDAGKDREPVWSDANRGSFDFEWAFKRYELPSQLQSSKLAQWVRKGKKKQTRRKWLIGGAILLGVVLTVAAIFFFA